MTSGYICIMFLIALVLSIISRWSSDEFGIDYRFWSRILKKRWLFEIVFWSLLILDIACFVLAWFFPCWCFFVLGGIWLGTIGSLLPASPGALRRLNLLSYKELYDIYITKAEFWEKHIEKQKKKRMNKKIWK